MDEKVVFDKILYVGIDYNNPIGGIASVLNTYSKHICPFKFVGTTAPGLKRISKILYATKGYIKLLLKLLSDKNIKIVHIHSASGTSFWRKSIAIHIAKVMQKKIVFHCHGGGFKEFRMKSPNKVDSILNKVDEVVCLSSEWKKYFESIGCKNVSVIRNIIENPKIERVEKDQIVHFLFLGCICDNKGIFDLLKALSNHREELLGKMVLHIGGNGQTERLVAEIKKLSIEQLVCFDGWVANEQKKLLLNKADVFILPSYIEGVPISILEAESYHKPVITTNVGGIPSIVRNHESGLFVTPGNIDEIFDAINKLLENKSLRRSYGEVGYQISRDYMPEAITEELMKLYDKILHDYRAAGGVILCKSVDYASCRFAA